MLPAAAQLQQNPMAMQAQVGSWVVVFSWAIRGVRPQLMEVLPYTDPWDW